MEFIPFRPSPTACKISAKAIYINWSIANQYGGKVFNLRLDDTNPARARVRSTVNSIIEDLHWLGADPQRRHLLRQRLL